MAEAFSCWYLTAEAWVCTLVDVRFVVNRVALGQANIIKVSCLSSSVFLHQYHSIRTPYPRSLAGYNLSS
jgi:hypothetical protein